MKKSKIIIGSTFLVLSVGISAFSFWSVDIKNSKEAIAIQDKNAKEIIEISGSMPLKSKKELISDSDIIIQGKVKSILPSKWSNPDFVKGKSVINTIQTDVSIDVKKIIKGTPYDTKNIIVRINKGTVGNTIQKSEGYPDFAQNENVLLFLSKDDGALADAETNKNYYVLTGMFQGKYSTGSDITSQKASIGGDFSKYINTNDKREFNISELEIEAKMAPEKNEKDEKKKREETRINNEKLFGKQ